MDPGDDAGVLPPARTVLGDRSVSLFLVISVVMSVGTFLQMAALAKQLYDLTGSPLALGYLGLAEFVPSVLLVPLTGTLADRFDRRRVATAAYIAEIGCAAALLWYLTSDPSATWPIYLIASCFGAARSFAIPAVRSIPPLIGPLGGLPRVIAYYSATWQGSAIVGPVAAGFLLEVGTAAPYVVSIVLFAVGAGLMLVLPLRRPQDRSLAEQRPTWGHAFEGLRYIRRTPVVFAAITLDLFAVLFGGAVALLPAIAEDLLGVGNVGYGWLRAAPGIGAVLVTLVLVVRPQIGRA